MSLSPSTYDVDLRLDGPYGHSPIYRVRSRTHVDELRLLTTLICIKVCSGATAHGAKVGIRIFMRNPSPLRVAVIAQDDAVRESLTLLLKMARYEALAFTSAGEFLSKTIAQVVDFLVLDEELPDMPALEMLQRLRQTGWRSDVVLFTERRSPDLLRRAKEAGVSEVWETPLIARDLIDFLSKGSGNIGPKSTLPNDG